MAVIVIEHDVGRILPIYAGCGRTAQSGELTWFARTMMARIWDDGILTVKSDYRGALAGTYPDTYFLDPASRVFSPPGAGVHGPRGG